MERRRFIRRGSQQTHYGFCKHVVGQNQPKSTVTYTGIRSIVHRFNAPLTPDLANVAQDALSFGFFQIYQEALKPPLFSLDVDNTRWTKGIHTNQEHVANAEELEAEEPENQLSPNGGGPESRMFLWLNVCLWKMIEFLQKTLNLLNQKFYRISM